MAAPAAVVTQDLPIAATQTGYFGLYPASGFRLTDGKCTDCATIPSARWYFEDETIGVPAGGLPIAGYDRATATFDYLIAWHAARTDDAPVEYPTLVCI